MLEQQEADFLMEMSKFFVDTNTIFLKPGLNKKYELVDLNHREYFHLDIWRASIRLSKIKYQSRCREILPLIRLEIDGAPHRNPDGKIVKGSHLHIYKEGYDLKWAYPIDSKNFPQPHDLPRTFYDFCRHPKCNIENVPQCQVDIL